MKVDKALMSLGTSLLLMDDSIMSATQALPTVDTEKGWVKDAFVLERSAAPMTMAPTIHPHQISSRNMVPSSCPPTTTGLTKLGSNILVDTRPIKNSKKF